MKEIIIIENIKVSTHAAERFNERILQIDSSNSIAISQYLIKESLDNRIHKVVKKRENAVIIKRKNAQFVIRNNLVLTTIEVNAREKYSCYMKLPAGFHSVNKIDKYSRWLEKEFTIVGAMNLITAIIKDKEEHYYTYNYKNQKLTPMKNK